MPPQNAFAVRDEPTSCDNRPGHQATQPAPRPGYDPMTTITRTLPWATPTQTEASHTHPKSPFPRPAGNQAAPHSFFRSTNQACYRAVNRATKNLYSERSTRCDCSKLPNTHEKGAAQSSVMGPEHPDPSDSGYLQILATLSTKAAHFRTQRLRPKRDTSTPRLLLSSIKRLSACSQSTGLCVC